MNNVQPVLIKPVVDSGFEVEVLSEVAWPCGCCEEFRFIWHRVGVVASRSVLVDLAEVESES